MITNSFDLKEEQFYQLPLNERKLYLLSKIVAEGGLNNKLKSMRAKISEYKELVSILELDSQITELIQTIQKKKFSGDFYFDAEDFGFLSEECQIILNEIKSVFGADSLVWDITNSQFELVYTVTSDFYRERYLLISESVKMTKIEFCDWLKFLLNQISLDDFYHLFEEFILERVKKRLIIEYSEKDSQNHYLNYTVQTPEECLDELVRKIQNDIERYSQIDFDLFYDKQRFIPMAEIASPILKERFEKNKTAIPFAFYCSDETIKLFCDPSKMSYQERFNLAVEVIQANLTSEKFKKVHCENFLELLLISPEDIFNHLLVNKKLQEYIGWIVKRDISVLNGETKPPHPEIISEEEVNYFDQLLLLMSSFNIKVQDLPTFGEISKNLLENFEREIVLSPKIILEKADYSHRVNSTGDSIFNTLQRLAELYSNININLEIYFTEKDTISIRKFFSKFLLGKCLDFVKWSLGYRKPSGTINLNFNINHSFESKKEIQEFENTLSKFDKAANLYLPLTVTVGYKPRVMMKAMSESQKNDQISEYFKYSYYNDTATINTVFW